jgi:LmbE family N-acetylglucosaminyl deacetylase
LQQNILRMVSTEVSSLAAHNTCLRQDVVFRVGSRLGKIKREELENAPQAVDGNALRFIRTFEEYIEEIRPDSTKEKVVELYRELCSVRNSC